MGWKENFTQAGKELLEGKLRSDPAGEQDPVSAAEAEASEETFSSAVDPVTALQMAINSGEAFRRKTVIAEETLITGDIRTDNDIELYGELRGDIVSKGDLFLQGKITGNITGCQASLHNLHMVGNLTAEGAITMDDSSSLEGNIRGESLVVDGKILGDIFVNGLLRIMSHATVTGNIKAQRLAVEEGACIQGKLDVEGIAVTSVYEVADPAPEPPAPPEA